METLLPVVNPVTDNKVADNKVTDNKIPEKKAEENKDEIIHFLKNEIDDLSSKYEQLSKELNELRKMFPNKES
jgi:archaellum component FlaC